MSLFIKKNFLVQLCLILAILHPTSLANLVVEVGTRHSHQTLLFCGMRRRSLYWNGVLGNQQTYYWPICIIVYNYTIPLSIQVISHAAVHLPSYHVAATNARSVSSRSWVRLAPPRSMVRKEEPWCHARPNWCWLRPVILPTTRRPRPHWYTLLSSDSARRWVDSIVFFGGGPGTFCWFFFNLMFMIWDSRHEDLQLFW